MTPPVGIPLKLWRWGYPHKKSAIDFCSAYSSTDNFLSAIPISDWFIFCCRDLMLHKKGTENNNFFFDEAWVNKISIVANSIVSTWDCHNNFHVRLVQLFQSETGTVIPKPNWDNFSQVRLAWLIPRDTGTIVPM